MHFQLIPEISSLSAVTTAVPLFSVLTLTAIKYGYDDIVSISYQIMAIVKRRSYNFTAEIIQEILGNFQVKLECLLQPPDSMNMEHKWMIMTNENLAYD